MLKSKLRLRPLKIFIMNITELLAIEICKFFLKERVLIIVNV